MEKGAHEHSHEHKQQGSTAENDVFHTIKAYTKSYYVLAHVLSHRQCV